MSGKLVGFVLDHGPRERTQAFVLVVLADAVPQRNDGRNDGWAFLGEARLLKRARYSRAAVLDALRKLEADGWFAAVERPAPGRPKRYRLSLEHLELRVQRLDPNGSDLQGNGSKGPRPRVQSAEIAPPLGTDLNGVNAPHTARPPDQFKAKLAAARRRHRQ